MSLVSQISSLATAIGSNVKALTARVTSLEAGAIPNNKQFLITFDSPSIAASSGWARILNGQMFHTIQCYNTTPAIGNTITFLVNMCAGTWNVNLDCCTYVSGGQVTLAYSTDGGTTWTNLSSIDMYSAAVTVVIVSRTGIVISKSGPVLWKFTVTGKNVSANNYNCLISALSGVCTT